MEAAITTFAITSLPSAFTRSLFISDHCGPARGAWRLGLLRNCVLPYGIAIYHSQPALHRQWKRRLPIQRAAVCPSYSGAMTIYKKSAVSGVTVAGTRQWINPDAFASVIDPSTGRLYGRGLRRQLPVRRFGKKHRSRPALRGFGHLHHQGFQAARGFDPPLRHPVVQRTQSSQLCAAQQCGGWCAGLLGPGSFWNLAEHYLSTHRSARRRTRR